MRKKLVVLALGFALAASAALADTSGTFSTEVNVIINDGVGEAFLFPIAGNVEGANRTHFRSEVTLVNFKAVDQEVLVEFLERGATVPSSEQRITLGARKFRFWDDFVGSELGRSGKLGSIRVRAVNPGTTVTDSSAQINGFARIWTQQPNGPGTSSMSLSAIQENDLSTSVDSAFIIGARQDTQYRTNVGIVNLATIDRVFIVEAAASRGAAPAPLTVLVAARSMEQVSLPEGSFGGVLVKITPTAAGTWSAYAATVDNQSGDGWISKAQYSTRRP